MHPQSRSLAVAAMLAGNAALALGPWMVRLAQIGPSASAFWRIVLALPFLLLLARVTGQRLPRDRVIVLTLIVGGLFFAFDLLSWHSGILRTKLANATLFGNVAAFFFPIYGFIIVRRLPGRRQMMSLLLAVIGMGLLFGRSYELSRGHLIGDLLCLLAGLLYTGYLAAIDRVRDQVGSWAALSVATLAGIVPIFLFAAASGPMLPSHWTPLVLLALGSQVIGQGLLVYAIGVLPPLVIGLGLLSQPAISAAIGQIVYGEMLNGLDIAGMIAIGLALLFVRSDGAKR